jgi:8-oxo-dGTP pyrophosphatase MutT (NUDIX family)
MAEIPQKDDPTRYDALSGEALPPAMPAATLIVFRESQRRAPPRLLMVQRSPKMVFAGGAAVFPGGRIDPDDFVLGQRFSNNLASDEAAARVAAIRETLEETGLGVGFADQPEVESLIKARAALHEGALFSEICGDHGWSLDLSELVAYARWCPSFKENRRFDTRFYIARDESRGQKILVDDTENTHLFWATAQEALQRANRADLKIIFPTRRNLERLAQYRHFEDARQDAARFPVQMIVPFIEEHQGERFLCLPENSGYPCTREVLSSAQRG